MSKINIIIFILIINLNSDSIYSQTKINFGVFLGASQSGTDVNNGAQSANIFEGINYAYGFNARYKLGTKTAMRLHYYGSTIYGNDQPNSARGFSFRSQLNELAFSFEYDIFAKLKGQEFKKSWSFFVFSGTSICLTSPNIDWNGKEGGSSTISTAIAQDKKEVKFTSIQFPLGCGIRYNFSEYMFLDLEASSRWPVFDYLDGISASGNPNNNDSYQFLGVSFGFKINRQSANKEVAPIEGPK